jgi:predicted acetyltransferase
MPPPEAVTLERVTAADQGTLANLLELYVHDLSEAVPLEVGPDGRFGYPNLPRYFNEPNTRFAWLIRTGPAIAGFVFVALGSPASPDPEVLDVAEFFVLRRYRRSGVGREAIRRIWDQLPGRWTVRVLHTNQRGLAFWPGVVAEYTHGQFSEAQLQVGDRVFLVLHFQTPGSGVPTLISR